MMKRGFENLTHTRLSECKRSREKHQLISLTSKWMIEQGLCEIGRGQTLLKLKIIGSCGETISRIF